MSNIRITTALYLVFALTACSDEIESGIFRCDANLECPPGFVCRHEGSDPRTYCFDTGEEERGDASADRQVAVSTGGAHDGGMLASAHDASRPNDGAAVVDTAVTDTDMDTDTDTDTDSGGCQIAGKHYDTSSVNPENACEICKPGKSISHWTTACAWQADEFSECSMTCGAGMQRRSVECVADDGKALPDELCKDDKPATSKECLATADCTWHTAEFSACSSTCGSGVQTRGVYCADPDSVAVDDGLCTATRPASSQTCFSDTGCSWSTGSWSECSAHCGSGTKARAVTCVDGSGQTVPGSYCTGSAPASTQSCSGPACTVYVVGEPTADNGPCWKPGCTGPTPAYPSCPQGYAATRSETACGDPNNCGGNWALCTFNQVTSYGCTGEGYSMPVAVRQCDYQ